MKTNRIKQLFCILFFLLCLVPLAVFLIAGPAEAGANERLPAKPRLMSGGAPNWDVLSDAADYYAGRFGLRQELITANAAVQAAVDACTAELGDSGRVLLRKSGTEPVLRVMAEAGSPEECEKQVDHIIEAMERSGHLIEVKK